MISCTEFIPAYSTLFSYLEENFGPNEVPSYWSLHFDYTKSTLYQFIRREGIRGCYSYWTMTLNEEAADFTMYLDEEKGYYYLDMHHCPSKGRLLKLKEEVGAEPYHAYCLHCDYYRAAAEACGLRYIYNFAGTDKAACSILIYDPAKFDGQVVVGDKTLVMDRRASDNEYFHQAFHGSLNRGMSYLEETYGEAHVRAYLQKFAKDFYWKIAEKTKAEGLRVIAEKIHDTYEKEHALEVLNLDLSGECLKVTVSECPAEKFLRGRNVTLTPLYYMSTSVVMETLAEMAGYQFSMDSYDPSNGAASYRFYK